MLPTAGKGRLGLRGGAVSLQAAGTTKVHVTTKSAEIMEQAKKIMPGGVSSPVRAFKSVGGGPIVFDRVKDQYAWDVDGTQFVQHVSSS
jgi:glutamate-1-semialdehyde 2,1-aminomutase